MQGRRETMRGRRGQVFTLEAVVAALVVLTGLVFAVQAVVMTPSTSGATADPVEVAQLNSVLSETADNGQLKRALLFWDETGGGFVGSGAFRYYTRDDFDNYGGGQSPEFLKTVNRSLDRTEAMNVFLRFKRDGGDVATHRMVSQGAPGDGAVRASTTVVLYDSDRLREPGGPTEKTLGEVSQNSGEAFYASDASPETDLFNVVEVEVVVWQ